MISSTTTGQETTEGRSVRDIVEHAHDEVTDAWCRKLFRQLLQSLERQYAMDMPHRAITADTVVFHQNGQPLLLPSVVSDPVPDEADDLTAIAKLIHYAITQELMPTGPLHGRGLDGYSDSLLTAVDRCMDPDPAQRPQTIAELRDILGIVPPGSAPLPPPPPLAQLTDSVPEPVPEPHPVPEPVPVPEPHPVPEPVPEPHPAPNPDPVPVPQPPFEPQPPLPPEPTVPAQALRASADKGSAGSATGTSSAPETAAAAAATAATAATAAAAATAAPATAQPHAADTRAPAAVHRPRWPIVAVLLVMLIAGYALLPNNSMHDQPAAPPTQDQAGTAVPADANAPAAAPGATTAPAAVDTVPQAGQPAPSVSAQDPGVLPAQAQAPAGVASTARPGVVPSLPAPAAPAGSPANTGTAAVVTAGTGNPNPNASATYRLQIQPWGTVYVDGVDRGVSPPIKRLQLPPGRHTVRVTNPNFQERVLEVDTAYGDGRIVVDFSAAE